MKPRRRPLRSPPRTSNGPAGPLQTRLHLLTYAISRLPPRQLPILVIYAYLVVYAHDRGWIAAEGTGKAGVAVVGVLSMVTGLLLSYSFSNAISKWEQGKKVWVDVRNTIRDAIRSVSIKTSPTQPSTPSDSSPENLDLSSDEKSSETPSKPEKRTSRRSSTPARDETPGTTPFTIQANREYLASERVNELSGLFVGFAFALQHHLYGTRPLPQPPLCDLLPSPYLNSLKRTEARVRFDFTPGPPESKRIPSPDPFRPKLRRRGTGPTPDDSTEPTTANGPTTRSKRKTSEDDWEIPTLGDAKQALSKAFSEDEDPVLKQQLSQLNSPARYATPTPQNIPGSQMDGASPRPKSNLTAPYPANLPLALLRLMEAYVVGLAEMPQEKGGWCEAKRERLMGEIKALSSKLGEAEMLSKNPPPLPLSLHLAHLLSIYLAALPCSLLCAVSGKSVIIITLIAGWCLLGLQALVAEVGGVFGDSENHHPLQEYAQQVLTESLDISPSFMRYYRARLVSRLGDEDQEVCELDRRCRRSGEEWMPSFDA